MIDKIRQNYQVDWKDKEMRIRQRAVALYFIDKVTIPRSLSDHPISISFDFSLPSVLAMKKMKTRPTLLVVAHYVSSIFDYTIDSKVSGTMLWNLIFLVKIVSGRNNRIISIL